MTEKGYTSLYIAAENNTNPEAVKILIEQTKTLDPQIRAERLNKALIYAAQSNSNPEIVKAFLEAGASILYKADIHYLYAAALFYAARSNNIEVVKVLLGQEDESRRKLIMQGVITTEEGETLLECSLRNWKPEIVRYILQEGANPNFKDNNGVTVLMKYVKSLSSFIDYGPAKLKALLDSGADINAQDNNGKTALMYVANNTWASSNDDTKPIDSAMQFIINAGADVNLQDNDGRTALMYAARRNLPVRVQMLLNAGAKVDITDKHGREAIDFTAWTFAKNKEKNESINILLKAGANDKDGKYKIDVPVKRFQVNKVSKDYDISDLAQNGTAKQIQEGTLKSSKTPCRYL